MQVTTMMRKPLRLGTLAAVALGLLIAPAQATHWPQDGSDAGSSSFQVSDQAFLPAPFRWWNTLSDYAPATSPVITGGTSFADQSVVVGIMGDIFSCAGGDLADATVHIQRFDTGADRECYDLDDEAQSSDTTNNAGGSDLDAWGPFNAVTPIEASSHNAPGQTYIVYNDDNASSNTAPNNGQSDISMAQIDSATGTLVGDRALQGGVAFGTSVALNGKNITAGPVISGDQGDGSRIAFFIAATVDQTQRFIVKLTIPSASTGGAYRTPSVALTPNIPDLNLAAKPTIVRLQDPDTGVLVTMVAAATTDGIKTFRSSNLADPGPSVSGLGLTWTPVAPVRADGNSPTSRPGTSSGTPVLYAASTSGESGTVVRRFMQDVSSPIEPDVERLKNLIPFQDDAHPASTSTSPQLSGTPSRQLALEQFVPTTGPDLSPQPGRVIVSTSKNIFSLDTRDLSRPSPPQVFKSDREVGFTKTFPSVSGGLGFIADDKGQQLVFLTKPNAQGTMRVPPNETGFLPKEENLNSTSAVGQPAISRGRFVFGADNGLFTYGPSTTITSPTPHGSVRGNAVTLQAYVADASLTSVNFYVDDEFVGSDIVNDDRTFSVTWNSLTKLDGPHTVRAEATDGVNVDRSATRTFVVVNFADPTARLTVGPNPANPGDVVTLDASASTPTPTEVDEIITQWAFELDGDGDFDDVVETAASGGDGRIQHVFEAGTRTVGVRVTDSHGDQAQKTESLRINAPPAANLAVTPNPAAEGQEVTVDAAGSTDADGSIARYEFDLDGNGTFEVDNGGNPKVQRVFAPGTTRLAARVTDNEGASSIVEATLVVNAAPANQIPAATFTATPNPAAPNQRVLFDARGAVDPDGTIVKYEWDLDGNGTFETNSQNNPRVQRSYATAKVYNVKLRVTDNAGAVSTEFTRPLTVRRAARKSPRRLTANVKPGRDRTVPYDFRTTGRLVRPKGVTRKAGCTGRVTVTVKAGKKTISRRTTKLRKNCTYRTSVRFRDRDRVEDADALRFIARFQGNRALRARQATTVRVRVG